MSSSILPEPHFPIDKNLNIELSKYDELFKASALKRNWDWRFLASIAYQESRYDPNARGFGGAYGMMQFMVLQVIGLVLIIIFPQIALWLPTLLYGQ